MTSFGSYRVFFRQLCLAVVFYPFCIGLSELAAARGDFACIQYASVYEKVYLCVLRVYVRACESEFGVCLPLLVACNYLQSQRRHEQQQQHIGKSKLKTGFC